MKLLLGTFVITLLVLFVGCESSFDPLDENDELVFSMNGVLDVHADTHWVRIMPIGTSVFPTNPDIEPVNVELTDNVSGETWTLKDSLFRFGNNSFVYNYLFADSVNPNQTYTLTATADDGRHSKVVVNTPSELPTPEASYSERNESTRVSGFTSDSLVVIDTHYLVQVIIDNEICLPEIELIYPLLKSSTHRPNGDYFAINEHRGLIQDDLTTPYFIINKRSIVVATSIVDWPNTTVLTDLEVAIPEMVSNVENGTGVVAGVARKEVILSPRLPPCKTIGSQLK